MTVSEIADLPQDFQLLFDPATALPLIAPASVQTLAEDVEFRSGDATLSGTLYLPKGGNALGAVVVTHGASSPLRNSPLYRHLREMLPPLGVAVFVYDRRGSGRSGGNLKASDYAMLADDALAALKRVKADPRIDPRRAGLWGLSQGVGYRSWRQRESRTSPRSSSRSRPPL